MRLKERVYKCLMGGIAAPIVFIALCIVIICCIGIMFILPFLPLMGLLFPDTIKINGE